MTKKYLVSFGIIASLLLMGCNPANEKVELLDDSEEVIEAVEVESSGDVDRDIVEIEKEIDELDLEEDFPDLDVTEIEAE